MEEKKLSTLMSVYLGLEISYSAILLYYVMPFGILSVALGVIKASAIVLLYRAIRLGRKK